MAATFTRFEVQLPLFADGSSQQNAVNTFKAGLLLLNGFDVYDAYFNAPDGSVTQNHIIYGLLTTTQQATALTLLVTLNTSLGTPVLCTTHTVTSQP